MASRDTANLPIIKKSVGFEWNGKAGHWDRTSWPKTMIVIHTIVGTIAGADREFNRPLGDPNLRSVSANYGVGLDGKIYQWVQERFTAYANGNYVVNQRAISIEHEDNWSGPPKPEPQRTDALYKSSAALVADICKFWEIPCNRDFIKKHSEVSLQATACPDKLDIDRIIREANQILNQTVSTPPQNQLTDGDRALQVIADFYKEARTQQGTQFGNWEGLTREMVEIYRKFSRGDLIPKGGTITYVVPGGEVVSTSTLSQEEPTQKDIENWLEKALNWFKRPK